MEFTIGRKEFLDELQKVQGVVEHNGVIPILSNVLIDASVENGGLYVYATNMNQWAKGFCNAQVKEGGKFTINARKLLDIIRALTDGEDVFMRAEGPCITLLSGNYNTRLLGLPVEDFPDFPFYKNESLVYFNSPQLKEMLKKTLFSTSSDSFKASLCGTLLEIEDSIVRMVSTDGFRLSFIEAENKNTAGKFAIIMPKVFTAEVLKLLSDSDGDVLFGVSGNSVVFKKDNFIFISNIINAQFPNYTVVLQNSNSVGGIVFNKDDLLQVLKRVSVVGNGAASVRVMVDRENVKVLCRSDGTGDAEEEIGVKYEGEPLTIGLNPKYVLDVLSVINSETVTIGVKNSTSPVIVTSDDSSSYKHIIMPVALN